MESNKVWFARNYRDGNLKVAVFNSQKYASGDTVIFNDDQWEEARNDDSLVVSVEASITGGRPEVSRVSFGSSFEGKCPLWFALISDTHEDDSAALLLGFMDDRFPEGTVTSVNDIQLAQIDPHAAAGSLRWIINSGVIHQIKAEACRQKVASKLLLTAEILGKVYDWPGLKAGAGVFETNLLAGSSSKEVI